MPSRALLVRDHYPQPRKAPQPALEAQFAAKQAVISTARSLHTGGSVAGDKFEVIAPEALMAGLRAAEREISKMSPLPVAMVAAASAGTVAYPTGTLATG